MRDLGLATASDQLIWDEASRDDAVVIRRDDDFVTLARTRGGARLVWVRVGNCSNPVLVATIEANWPAVAGRLSDGERLVELRA